MAVLYLQGTDMIYVQYHWLNNYIKRFLSFFFNMVPIFSVWECVFDFEMSGAWLWSSQSLKLTLSTTRCAGHIAVVIDCIISEDGDGEHLWRLTLLPSSQINKWLSNMLSFFLFCFWRLWHSCLCQVQTGLAWGDEKGGRWLSCRFLWRARLLPLFCESCLWPADT